MGSPEGAIGWTEGLLILLLTLVGAGYSLVTPAGEAPDEPAHLEYVDTLIEDRRLPSLAPVGRWHYESHQPPLDYVVSAVLAHAVNGGPTRLIARDPQDRQYPRHLDVESGSGPERLRRLRLARVFWLPLLLVALLLFLRTGGLPRDVTLAALVTMGAAPQLLWLSGVVTNDVSLAFWCALSMVALARTMTSDTPSHTALGLFLVVLAALMTKASGVALLPTVAAGVGWCLANRQRFHAAAIALAGAAAASWWILFNVWRYGSIVPSVPRIGGQEIVLGNLAADPLWPLKVVATFWARFGWLNVSLPIYWYAFFALVTLVIGAGIALSLKWKSRGVTALALTLLATNCGLQAIYLAAYDYQTQGRYLYPSIAALAFFLAVAMDRLRGRTRRVLSITVPLAMVVAGVTGVWWIRNVYG